MKTYLLPPQTQGLLITASLLALGSAVGCTAQLPGSFRYLQQTETFKSTLSVNTKIDLLWVVDNSASMDISQEKLRKGFETFAVKYMKPTWDIRLAVITTDTYMAHPAFATYRSTVIPGSTGWSSTYVNSRLSTFENPSWNPDLVNLSTGVFDNGIRPIDLVPAWSADYARLIGGKHDGPISAFCLELMPYFLRGITLCDIRDDQLDNTGVENCINPAPGETSVTQCVNTIQNDTVRSGRAIIETQPPEGTPANAAWTDALIRDAIVNLTTGSAGQGSERGFSSVLQLISDNESTGTAFFRPDSNRGIIFVADEDDQSMTVPASPAASWSPSTDYKCDQAGLVALNPGRNVTGAGGLCCSGGGCTYGALGTTCPSKTVDGFTYTPSVCPDETKLIPVQSVKDELDTFFKTLDGSGAEDPANFFVVSISPITKQSIQALQADRTAMDTSVGALKTVATDQGDRYIALGTLVGNGSDSLDIGVADYTPILEKIGKTIVEKTGTFELERAPTDEEEMIVTIIHSNGGRSVVDPAYFIVSGKFLVIEDVDFVLTLKSDDRIEINYQPSTLY